MYFLITTTKELAEKIKKASDFEEKTNPCRTCIVGRITDYEGFSDVQIKAKDGLKIEPSDIFWLGHLSAGF